MHGAEHAAERTRSSIVGDGLPDDKHFAAQMPAPKQPTTKSALSRLMRKSLSAGPLVYCSATAIPIDGSSTGIRMYVPTMRCTFRRVSPGWPVVPEKTCRALDREGKAVVAGRARQHGGPARRPT